jgi:hypothetical protein
VPNAGEIPVCRIVMADDVEDDAGDQGFGFFVPMRLGFVFIEHQCIGEREVQPQVYWIGVKRGTDYRPIFKTHVNQIYLYY